MRLAFTPDGSKLYFRSQRGPSGTGVVYEMSIPPRFRAIQKAGPFNFRERLNVTPDVTVTTEPVTMDDFLGQITVTISEDNDAESSIDEGEWTTLPAPIEAGQIVCVRHTSSETIGMDKHSFQSSAGRIGI